MNRRIRYKSHSAIQALVLCIWMCLALISIPGMASAHAELERSEPEANVKYEQSPKSVELRFNESIEAKVGAIEVLDSKSRPVTSETAQASKDHQSLILPLPSLGEGVYTVSYSVISEDGHPVSGSYVFIVGNPQEGVDAATFDPHKELGHEGHSAATQLTTGQFIIYAARIVYYGSLLWAAGLMLWPLLTRGRGKLLPDLQRKWEQIALRTLLVGTLVYIFVHAREILTGYPRDEYSKLFLQTNIGREWIALLVLVLLGFIIVRFPAILKTIWALLILALESWSGHAAVFAPKTASVMFDFVHLAAAAIWIGGLILLGLLWQADRKEAGRFAVLFSRAALLSLALLILSGIGMTLLFLPSLNYLFYTAWGTILLVKTGLVLLVLVVGGILHLRVRRGNLPTTVLLRIDAALMALIIVSAALFTYISPLPANEPVVYHKMGDTMHLSLRVTPNKPGDNQFIVKVWLPDAAGAPKSVTMRLFALDQKELGPIQVPIKLFEDTEITTFDGYVKAAYKAEGPFVPFAGRWQAEIRVLDKDDNEQVQKVKFRNY
ncbi:copper resistance protein CopC [Paenibacillus sp. BC26]|uniref:copper resistance CopC/CopD family protein n=1 Tax=Paenibacillus sp. BC26 TaxID=1881032 RepID=UPI0008F2AD86|nr:copper resistance protein CopC [Paenibacillus sp. BC26]SFS49595.1 copper transport protein [Paenibacillus sp. BC26]